MDNIIIGVISRDENINDSIYKVISKNNFKYLNNKCSYIGIINMDNDKIDLNIINICDGIIIPGGDKICNYHFKLLDYCVENNIPILGICMGCQIIGLYSFGGNDNDLIKIDGHHMSNHYIDIDKNSVLYNLLGDKVIVNSRHKYALPNSKVKYRVGSRCENVIESIEHIDDNYFLLGIEWHPEDIDNMEGIYNYFLKEVLKRKFNKDKKYYS